MRIWSVHPAQLDRIGLVAGWRETLLAQAVLAGNTKGYHNHPQLIRFREQADPLATVGAYLAEIAADASRRGYNFNAAKILHPAPQLATVTVTTGQLEYEWQHLGRKLEVRSPADAERWRDTEPTPHPLFRVVPGDIEHWERT